jgi:hypothetical protein
MKTVVKRKWKKYKRGPQLSVKTRKEEREWITHFALQHLTEDPDAAIISMEEIFNRYQVFLATQGKGTQLNIDGFGRLFPKFFTRKSMHYGPGNRVCVIGARLV